MQKANRHFSELCVFSSKRKINKKHMNAAVCTTSRSFSPSLFLSLRLECVWCIYHKIAKENEKPERCSVLAHSRKTDEGKKTFTSF